MVGDNGFLGVGPVSARSVFSHSPLKEIRGGWSWEARVGGLGRPRGGNLLAKSSIKNND